MLFLHVYMNFVENIGKQLEMFKNSYIPAFDDYKNID